MTGAVIIGAGPGLGRALALAFARLGGPVALVSRRADSIAATADDVRADGTQAETFSADVRDESALRAVLAGSVARFGVPDALIYNAAVIQRDGVGELDAAQHEHAWGVNVVGALTAVAELAPLMADRGSGSILLTGGMPVPDPDYVSLSLGKAGVRALTDLLAARYEPSGVHVATVTVGGAIEPGTALDADVIAAHYVRLHQQSPSEWQRVTALWPGDGGA